MIFMKKLNNSLPAFNFSPAFKCWDLKTQECSSALSKQRNHFENFEAGKNEIFYITLNRL
jgi:hypothetical protein